jgi:hypothetical protein
VRRSDSYAQIRMTLIKIDSVKPMSKPDTLNVKSKLPNKTMPHLSKSTKSWRKSTRKAKQSWNVLLPNWDPSKHGSWPAYTGYDCFQQLLATSCLFTGLKYLRAA